MPKKPGGCLLAIFKLFASSKESESELGRRKRKSIHDEATEDLPYVKKTSLLTTAEKNFYDVLTTLCGSNLVVFCQVNLREIFRIDSKNWNKYGRAIGQYSIDFLLCKPKTLEPVLSIELNDSSHARQSRQDRDKKIRRYHEAAGLPLLFIATASSYDKKELGVKIKEALSR